eukprot:3367123-Lingulodinium_polyedra.AAC.1
MCVGQDGAALTSCFPSCLPLGCPSRKKPGQQPNVASSSISGWQCQGRARQLPATSQVPALGAIPR